jgi:hypothetical protein
MGALLAATDTMRFFDREISAALRTDPAFEAALLALGCSSYIATYDLIQIVFTPGDHPILHLMYADLGQDVTPSVYYVPIEGEEAAKLIRRLDRAWAERHGISGTPE